METSKELKIVIVADNPLFAEMLKKTMSLGLEEDVVIKTLGSADVFLKELESNRVSSDVVVLDYKLNKRAGEEKDCKSVIDQIRRVSPETAIVVISDEKDMLEAAKTLQYGANEYVSKDKFAFSHITNAVKSCLNPSRS
ncbi:MAG: putative two component, sigma54 specific, transcriptional regulator, Fis family [Bacteroidetes bacterium]|jgi:DNA-binding NarL/FixJ family response regulator|nr:putative two component, sigma54 specific, transcriptional regulator, Fis family [Bacteroidota bacterium]